VGLSSLLKWLNLSRQKTRPSHPNGHPAVQAAFKKNLVPGQSKLWPEGADHAGPVRAQSAPAGRRRPALRAPLPFCRLPSRHGSDLRVGSAAGKRRRNGGLPEALCAPDGAKRARRACLDQVCCPDARALHVPETITPPPYASHRLKPAERVWLSLLKRYLSNRVLDSDGAVLEAVCRACCRRFDETGRLKSLLACPYLAAS